MTNAKNGPKRALIVIDVQNDYGPSGGLPIEFPPYNETLPRVGMAMDAASAAGVKIVVVKMINPENAAFFARGSHGGELHPTVASRPRDHYVEKSMPSAFTNTNLEAWLRANDVDTVTICGYMTHNCDLSTIVHAMHMGFAVEFLNDATGSVPYQNRAGFASAEEIHRVMAVVMQSRFAAVLSTDEWIQCLKTGDLPERDNIPSSNRRARSLGT